MCFFNISFFSYLFSFPFFFFSKIFSITKNAKEVNIWFFHTSYASLSIIQIQLELSKFYAKGTVRPNFNSDDINFETNRALKPSHSFQLFSQTPPKLIIFYLNPTDTHWRSKSLETTSNSNGNVSIEYISPTQKRWTYLLFLISVYFNSQTCTVIIFLFNNNNKNNNGANGFLSKFNSDQSSSIETDQITIYLFQSLFLWKSLKFINQLNTQSNNVIVTWLFTETRLV